MNSDFNELLKRFELISNLIIDTCSTEIKSIQNINNNNEINGIIDEDNLLNNDLEAICENEIEEISKLEEEIVQLKDLLKNKTQIKEKLKSKLKILETAYNETENELKELMLLEKAFITLTGINFVTSRSHITGYIEDKKNRKLKPFSFKKNEDDINGKLTQLLKEIHC